MNESIMMFLFEEEQKDILVYLLFLSYFIRDFIFIHNNLIVNHICVKIN